eukprot:gb/GEZN01005989.1/.p1 GENE.gb/GEZN01005989.1/~~gb/GEZN01005989.1/.p1  ORF type:complete len:372 (+),score=43.26 gb/GEZN01005989.1/:72-1118(+)
MASSQKKQKTITAQDGKLEALWTGITCGELALEKKLKLITIPHNATVSDACLVLAQNGISSAPIYDNDEGVVVGMFDFRDLGACLVRVTEKLTPEELAKADVKLSTILSHESAELASDLSKHNHFHSVYDTSPLIEAVAFFGQGQHRVLVLNKSRDIVGILSQSDALQYLKKNIKASGMADVTLESLKVIAPKEQVVAIPQDRSVLDALKLMQSKAVSSLAMVDREGNLCGNFSITDIKYLLKLGRLDTLHHSVHDFIRKVRLAKDMEMHGKTQALVFTATTDAKLESVVGKLAATRAHRLWIIHNPSSTDRGVAGVVTLSDILRTLTPKESQALWKHQPLISFVPQL